MNESNVLNEEDESSLIAKFADKNVLVVDDEYVSSLIISKILSKYFNVVVAETAEDCLSKVTEEKYSLIFMDINLGYGISGLDLVKRIREFKEYKSTAIITTTAFAMKDDKEKFIISGCSDYISKPFERHQIVKLLKQIKL